MPGPIRTIAGLILVACSLPAVSADAVRTGLFDDRAAGGHDVVAYFTEGRPVKGSAEFTTEYLGAEWRFASRENLDAFVADPEAWAPQYGGYCAWAVADGKLAAGRPEHWSIVDGRLFLNYSRSIQERWESDRDALIDRADRNWPSVVE